MPKSAMFKQAAAYLLISLLGLWLGFFAKRLTTVSPLSPYQRGASTPQTNERFPLSPNPSPREGVLDQLTPDVMDLEISLSNRTDRQFALRAFFGGDKSRQAQAERIARRLSNGKYDDHGQLDAKYKAAKDDETKRNIYSNICYERLYALMYLQEISRRSGLLIQPTSDTTSRPASIVNQQGGAPK